MKATTGFRICMVVFGINIALVAVHLLTGNMVMAVVSVGLAIASAVVGSLWWRNLRAAR